MYDFQPIGKSTPGEPPTRAPFRSSMLVLLGNRLGAALWRLQVYQVGLHKTRAFHNLHNKNSKVTYKTVRWSQLMPASYTGKRTRNGYLRT